MIVLSNTTAQLIQPGQAITFDKLIFKSGCGECYRKQLPKSVALTADRGGVYSLGFSGNVTSATAGSALQLAIAIGGEALVETAMNSTPSAANALNNISTETRFQVGCKCSDANRVSVINTGATPVTLAPNSSLVIDRRG